MTAMLQNLMEKWGLIYYRIKTVSNDGNMRGNISFIIIITIIIITIIIITIDILETLGCLMLTFNVETVHFDGLRRQMPSAVMLV
jgi:hypothetical protein